MQKFTTRMKEKFRVEQLLPVLTAGFVIGTIRLTLTVSLAVLVFSGDLKIFLPFGMSIALLSTIIILLISAFFSSLEGMISSVQDTSVILVAIGVTAVAEQYAGQAPAVILGNVLAFLMITTISAGIFYWIVGWFNLGVLVRFIPFPVMGGFLAGVGWLLVRGGLAGTVTIPLTLANLPTLFLQENLFQWLPAIGMAIIMLLLTLRLKSNTIMPIMVIGVTLLFHLIVVVSGNQLQDPHIQEWLLSSLVSRIEWDLSLYQTLQYAEPLTLLANAQTIAIVLFVGTLHQMLNISGIEIVAEKDININRELRLSGIANIFAGAIGGLIGYQSLASVAIGLKMSGRTRMIEILAALTSILMLFFGSSLFAYFPKLVIGGTLIFMGLVMLVEWVVDARQKFSLPDYLIVILILIVIAWFGFLEGVAVGLAATIILFLVNYSQISVIKNELSGLEIQSNVQRYSYHEDFLLNGGNRIYILRLQGFLFFGTANTILERLRARLDNTELVKPSFVILDFQSVTGFDSSVTMTFTKCRQLAAEYKFALIFSHLTEEMHTRLIQMSVIGGGPNLRVHPDLDHSLEWCEERMLVSVYPTMVSFPTSLQRQLIVSGFDEESANRLLKYLESKFIKGGEYLIRKGERSKDMFFLEHGKVSVYLDLGQIGDYRAMKLGAGTIVGELSLYTGSPRTASIVADEPSLVYRFSEINIQRMGIEEPDLAIKFHTFVAGLIAERLQLSHRSVEALMK